MYLPSIESVRVNVTEGCKARAGCLINVCKIAASMVGALAFSNEAGATSFRSCILTPPEGNQAMVDTISETVDVLKRLERSEKRLERTEYRLERAEQRQKSIAGLAMLTLVGSIFFSTRTPGHSQTSGQLQTEISALQNTLKYVTTTGTDMVISGANLHIVNGAGATTTKNGLGNLMIGYNELRSDTPNTDVRTGSHNLILGEENSVSSYGGIVGGRHDTIAGTYACVDSGLDNSATGDYAIVGGGYLNSATGQYSNVAGGQGNTATGVASTINGGQSNTAGAQSSSVSGGNGNTASGTYSIIAGGFKNVASGQLRIRGRGPDQHSHCRIHYGSGRSIQHSRSGVRDSSHQYDQHRNNFHRHVDIGY